MAAPAVARQDRAGDAGGDVRGEGGDADGLHRARIEDVQLRAILGVDVEQRNDPSIVFFGAAGGGDEQRLGGDVRRELAVDRLAGGGVDLHEAGVDRIRTGSLDADAIDVAMRSSAKARMNSGQLDRMNAERAFGDGERLVIDLEAREKCLGVVVRIERAGQQVGDLREAWQS